MKRRKNWLVLVLGMLIAMASVASIAGCEVDVHGHDHPHWHDDHHYHDWHEER